MANMPKRGAGSVATAVNVRGEALHEVRGGLDARGEGRGLADRVSFSIAIRCCRT